MYNICQMKKKAQIVKNCCHKVYKVSSNTNTNPKMFYGSLGTSSKCDEEVASTGYCFCNIWHAYLKQL